LYYFHLEVARTAASNKTLIPAQENVLLCRGNVCIYCGNCRDWIDDDDDDCGNKYDRKLDKRRWHRTPDAECSFGDHHFSPYYHHPDDDSKSFCNCFLKDHDHVADFFDDSDIEHRFYDHFYNVCKCV
jgi:hypothetical protein